MDVHETKRSLQAKESRQQIVNVYIELVKEYGIDNVTVKDICEKINISVGRLYHYFKTKDELISCFYLDIDNIFSERLKGMIKLNSAEKLLEYFCYLSEHNQSLGLGYAKRTCNASGKSIFFRKPEENSKNFGEQLTKQFIEEFRIRTDRMDFDLLSYLRMVHRGILFDWVLRDGDFDLLERTRMIMQYNINCIIQNYSEKDQ